MDTLTTLTVTDVSPDAPDVRGLLERHFQLMRATSPEESCHVIAPDAVCDADLVMMGVQKSGVLLAIGAFKAIGADTAELKSMHTAKEARGQGAARQLLTALLERAQKQGHTQIYLETGSGPEFSPARALYASTGFKACPPFGDYTLDPLSAFMTRAI